MLNPNRNVNYAQLIALMQNTVEMLDFSRAISLFYHALQCQNVPGDVVEFGCNLGHTAKILTAIQAKPVWVYDSFEGMPHWGKEDEPPGLGPGQNKVSPEQLIANFQKDGLRAPTVTKGWFRDVKPERMPDAIAFAHVDGDFYQSILDGLAKVWPRISKGGICIVDDYCDPGFRGVEKAVNEFLADIGDVTSTVQPWGTDGSHTTHIVIKKL